MLLINNVRLPLDTDFSDLRPAAAKALRLPLGRIVSSSLYRKSVDARKKSDVYFCCSLAVGITGDESAVIRKNKNVSLYNPHKYVWKKASAVPKLRPIVAGFGPAGMFAALTLARAGMRPIVFERGRDADTRQRDVNVFFKTGKLDPESNVQFGEGGAGTFSDGKLNTGIKDTRCRTVLEVLASNGAPQKILTDAKPHIGTDILVEVVKNIRREIVSLGGEVHFGGRLEDIRVKNGRIVSAVVSGQELECQNLILAIGHSARDTFAALERNGTAMERKPFAMGVRIEHLQSDINKALYGGFAGHPALSAADYKLAVHLENGRGVYTFCMCPGGEVINASSEEGGIAVNGMSRSLRDGVNANSAVLVGVNPDDLPGDSLLAGCELQRKIESAAFNIGKGRVPVSTVGSFVYGKPFELSEVKPTVKPGYCFAELERMFPGFITESLKAGIPLLGKKLPGFDNPSAVLTAPETRSSSPVRILRGTGMQSLSAEGLFPCGEGAGYAGGIMSAAVDGIKAAEAVIGNAE